MNYEDDDSFTITAITTNINGCVDTTSFEDAIVISTAPDFASFTSTVTNACGPYCVQVVADNVLNTYQWSYRTTSGGAWSYFPGNSDNELLCLTNLPSYLEIQLEGDQGSCSDEQVVAVAFPATAQATFNISDATPCQGDIVGFEATGATAIDHAWTVDGVPVPGGALMNHLFAVSGTYTVCLSVTDPEYGCPSSLCQTVEVNIPDASVDLTLTPTGLLHPGNRLPRSSSSGQYIRLQPDPHLPIAGGRDPITHEPGNFLCHLGFPALRRVST